MLRSVLLYGHAGTCVSPSPPRFLLSSLSYTSQHRRNNTTNAPGRQNKYRHAAYLTLEPVITTPSKLMRSTFLGPRNPSKVPLRGTVFRNFEHFFFRFVPIQIVRSHFSEAYVFCCVWKRTQPLLIAGCLASGRSARVSVSFFFFF